MPYMTRFKSPKYMPLLSSGVYFWTFELYSKKLKERNHLGYLLISRVKQHCTISAFTVLDLYDLSRSHMLYKQIRAESQAPTPLMTPNPSYFYSATFDQPPC